MQNFLTPRFILTFIFIGVISTAISAVLFSPQIGFFNWITTFFSAMTPLRFLGLILTIVAAAGASYAAARIGADHLGHSNVSMTQDRYMARGRVHAEVAELLDRTVAITDE